MSRIYENSGENDIKNDNDFRIAILNKTNRAWELFLTIMNDNIELHRTVTFVYGKEGYEAYPNRQNLMDYNIVLDAYLGMITTNLCVLLGRGRNDKLSILKAKEQYDTAMIDTFYAKNEQQLDCLFDARNQMYAHIDNDISDSAFNLNYDFLKVCIYFLADLFRRGKK